MNKDNQDPEEENNIAELAEIIQSESDKENNNEQEHQVIGNDGEVITLDEEKDSIRKK